MTVVISQELYSDFIFYPSLTPSGIFASVALFCTPHQPISHSLEKSPCVQFREPTKSYYRTNCCQPKALTSVTWLVHLWIDACILIAGNPSPRGGFCVEWFPDQEPCVRDFTTRCVNKETPPGGGGFLRSIGMTNSSMTWLIHMWHDSSIYGMTYSNVTYLIDVWLDSCIQNMTYSYTTWLMHLWHDSFIGDMTHSCATWLIHMWRDSFICDMTHSYVSWPIHMWQDLFIRDMTLWRVTRLFHV